MMHILTSQASHLKYSWVEIRNQQPRTAGGLVLTIRHTIDIMGIILPKRYVKKNLEQYGHYLYNLTTIIVGHYQL